MRIYNTDVVLSNMLMVYSQHPYFYTFVVSIPCTQGTYNHNLPLSYTIDPFNSLSFAGD